MKTGEDGEKQRHLKWQQQNKKTGDGRLLPVGQSFESNTKEDPDEQQVRQSHERLRQLRRFGKLPDEHADKQSTEIALQAHRFKTCPPNHERQKQPAERDELTMTRSRHQPPHRRTQR